MEIKQQYNGVVDTEHVFTPAIHHFMGETISNYKKLAKDPATMDIWTTVFSEEFGNMAQGNRKTNTPGTDSIFIMERNEIRNIPVDQTVTYARLLVDYWPQKKDPNRV